MVDFGQEVIGEGTAMHRRQNPVTGFADQAASVAGDLLEIAELQARLARADAELAAKRLPLSLTFLAIGGCASLASLPVLAQGFAAWIVALTAVEPWQAQLLVGSILLAGATITILLAWRGVRKASSEFKRSSTEFCKNMAWLKAILARSH